MQRIVFPILFPATQGPQESPVQLSVLFAWSSRNEYLHSSTQQLVQKEEASPLSHLALAWKISVLLLSSNATAPEEPAIILQTSTASG